MNTNDSFNQTKTVTARIVSVHKNRFQIALDTAEQNTAEHDAVLAGRLLYRGEIPVVGDYIEAEFEKENDCAEKRKTNKIIVQYSKITAEN